MKISKKGNMYEVLGAQTEELFGEFFDGPAQGMVGVVSSGPLEPFARTALDRALTALGYEQKSASYLTLCSKTNSENLLDELSLFQLIEAIDPFIIIGCDTISGIALNHSYRLEIPLMKPARLFGRSIVCFSSFSSLLDCPENKQKAWALLKRLPRLKN